MKRVGLNYYFQKYESNGGTRGNPRGPSNTTLQWFIFQKNNTLRVHCTWNIYLFFPNIFMLPNERVIGGLYVHTQYTFHISSLSE